MCRFTFPSNTGKTSRFEELNLGNLAGVKVQEEKNLSVFNRKRVTQQASTYLFALPPGARGKLSGRFLLRQRPGARVQEET